jgi:hypothetical protein
LIKTAKLVNSNRVQEISSLNHSILITYI